MFDPSDYCEACGEPRPCGCPADTGTQDLMRCLKCGGQWWRPWGKSTTCCTHRGCASILSVVLRRAEYPPRTVAERQQDDGPEQCAAELIDGTWTYCGCPDCGQRQYDDVESEFEAGHLTEAEALDQHAMNGAA
ncbi:hypothetical protein AB0P17_36450 [Streptomyces sp. NPDC088124]|uniref:hypothetical protein n=1 Tax=Streptomyces sp. NPDC088124 TaxID=3154654 RepID=UPI00343C99ED